MNAREKILSLIKVNKPSSVILNDIPGFAGDNSVSFFIKNLETISGKAIEVSSANEIEKAVRELFPQAKQIASQIIPSSLKVNENTGRGSLEQIEVAILNGEFGVAENGAIWLPESNMLNRSLPFIAQHLVLVLRKEDIVSNMHEAYERCYAGSYGSFITGPSKTADIEQSLVIGAHGARSLTVILY
jgi:L-lactate dehydrogenase complex protein LldG